MYGMSTLVMHHREFFTGHERRVAPDYKVIQDGSCELTVKDEESSEEVASRVLSDLGISGSHSVRGDVHSGTLIINRNRPFGSYRVTFDAKEQKLKVERQKWGLAFFLEMLHRRHGFREAYLANDLWAWIVDFVIGAIVLWGATGLWMWFELSRTRKWGSVCLIAGSSLFALLLFIL